MRTSTNETPFSPSTSISRSGHPVWTGRLLIAGITLAAAAPVFGQPASHAGTTWEIGANVAHSPSVGFRDRDTRIRSTRYGTGVTLRHTMENGAFAGITLRASTVDNQFNTSPAPWGDYRELELGARWAQRINEEWGFLALGGVQMAAERGTSISRGTTYSMGGALQYQVQPDLRLGFGGLFNTRLDRSNRVLPFLSVDWRISPEWQLTSANGLILRHTPDPGGPHSYEGAILWSSHQFRTRPSANGARASVEEKGWLLTLAYAYRSSWGWTVRPYAGVHLRRDFEVRAAGTQVDRGRTASSLQAGLSAYWTF